MGIEARRESETADTMNGATGTNATGSARWHGVTLTDPGSARVPPGQTITLSEWRVQQDAPERQAD